MKQWKCDVKGCLGINLLRCFSSIARRVLQRFPILSRKDELRETIVIIIIITTSYQHHISIKTFINDSSSIEVWKSSHCSLEVGKTDALISIFHLTAMRSSFPWSEWVQLAISWAHIYWRPPATLRNALWPLLSSSPSLSPPLPSPSPSPSLSFSSLSPLKSPPYQIWEPSCKTGKQVD